MRALSFVMLLLLCCGASAEPEAPTKLVGKCTNVYIIDEHGGGAANRVVHEVSASIDGQAFAIKGKLLRGDWGAFVACGDSLKLRFRGIWYPEPPSVFGALRGKKQNDTYPEIRPVVRKDDDYIRLDGRSNVYLHLGKPGGWIDEALGKERIARINEDRANSKLPPSGWDWPDGPERRRFIYGPEHRCVEEKSERCP